MKYESKIYNIACLILLAGLLGCINERYEIPVESSNRPVIFSPKPDVKAANTRALPGHPVENIPGQSDAGMIPDDKSFGVYAWVKLSASDPIDNFAELQNIEVTRNGTQCSYAPIANWPKEQNATLSFFGYYPHSASVDAGGRITTTRGTGSNQWMRIAYSVPQDAGKHIDLMYAKTNMTTGYDPVNLNFNHALARLKFEGRTDGYPSGAQVKITGIKVKGAILKGEMVVLDPTTQPGKPWWELDDAVKGDMTIPAAHINDIVLSDSPQAVIHTGGDMLVLPQQVSGLSIEITLSQDGTAFPDPCIITLDGTPDWTMNEIFTYEISVTPSGVFIATKVDEWTTDPVNVVYDGQYEMQLSENQSYFSNEGGSLTVTVTTDYDGAYGTHPAGLYISTTETAQWLTVTNGGANGDMSRTITLTTTAFPSASADRETSFTIIAGNLNYKYKVTQSKDPWLTVDADEANLLDGGSKYMQVSSYFNWNVSIKAGTNPYSLIQGLSSTSGGKKMNEKLHYTVYNNMTLQNPAYDLNFVTFTFTHPEGIYPDKEVTLGLVTGIFRESSNCYILNPDTRPILIPLSRANQSDMGTLIGQSDQLRSEFVWSDNQNGLAANSNIRYVTSVDRGQGGYMYVSPGSKEGNAVVGVKTGGNICWSWHIWILDATDTPQVIDGLMDRDLGAVSAGPWEFPRPPAYMSGPSHDTSQEPAVGLNYQWGRKDPFPTSGIRAASGINPTTGYITGNTLLTSIRNPNSVINDWNYPAGDNSYSWPAKSLYDPCPVDWIVSPEGSWVAAQPLIFVDAFEGKTTNGNFIPCYQYGGSGAWVHSSWLASLTNNVWTLALYNWTSGIYVNNSGSTPAAGQFPIRCVRQ